MLLFVRRRKPSGCQAARLDRSLPLLTLDAAVNAARKRSPDLVVGVKLGRPPARVDLLGAEHAGVDCGFGTFAGSQLVEESVVWTKLRVLRQGADLATRRLWG